MELRALVPSPQPATRSESWAGGGLESVLVLSGRPMGFSPPSPNHCVIPNLETIPLDKCQSNAVLIRSNRAGARQAGRRADPQQQRRAATTHGGARTRFAAPQLPDQSRGRAASILADSKNNGGKRSTTQKSNPTGDSAILEIEKKAGHEEKAAESEEEQVQDQDHENSEQGVNRVQVVAHRELSFIVQSKPEEANNIGKTSHEEEDTPPLNSNLIAASIFDHAGVNLSQDLETRQPSLTSKVNSLNSGLQFQNQALVQGLGSGGALHQQLSGTASVSHTLLHNHHTSHSNDGQNKKFHVYSSRNNIAMGLAVDSKTGTRQANYTESPNYELADLQHQMQRQTENYLQYIREREYYVQSVNVNQPININVPAHFDHEQRQRESGVKSMTTHDRMVELQLKNPSFKLDLNQSLTPKLVEILSQNSRSIIQRDGNIKLKGFLIKGAPSLGTKFNPQFRDSHHRSLKPQSRGLTQGKIIQIASKAVAVMSQPASFTSAEGTGPHSTRRLKNRLRNANSESIQNFGARQRPKSQGAQGLLTLKGTKKMQTVKDSSHMHKNGPNKDLNQVSQTLSGPGFMQGAQQQHEQLVGANFIQPGGTYEKLALNVDFQSSAHLGQASNELGMDSTQYWGYSPDARLKSTSEAQHPGTAQPSPGQALREGSKWRGGGPSITRSKKPSGKQNKQAEVSVTYVNSRVASKMTELQLHPAIKSAVRCSQVSNSLGAGNHEGDQDYTKYKNFNREQTSHFGLLNGGLDDYIQAQNMPGPPTSNLKLNLERLHSREGERQMVSQIRDDASKPGGYGEPGRAHIEHNEILEEGLNGVEEQRLENDLGPSLLDQRPRKQGINVSSRQHSKPASKKHSRQNSRKNSCHNQSSSNPNTNPRATPVQRSVRRGQPFKDFMRHIARHDHDPTVIQQTRTNSANQSALQEALFQQGLDKHLSEYPRYALVKQEQSSSAVRPDQTLDEQILFMRASYTQPEVQSRQRNRSQRTGPKVNVSFSEDKIKTENLDHTAVKPQAPRPNMPELRQTSERKEGRQLGPKRKSVPLAQKLSSDAAGVQINLDIPKQLPAGGAVPRSLQGDQEECLVVEESMNILPSFEKQKTKRIILQTSQYLRHSNTRVSQQQSEQRNQEGVGAMVIQVNSCDNAAPESGLSDSQPNLQKTLDGSENENLSSSNQSGRHGRQRAIFRGSARSRGGPEDQPELLQHTMEPIVITNQNLSGVGGKEGNALAESSRPTEPKVIINENSVHASRAEQQTLENVPTEMRPKQTDNDLDLRMFKHVEGGSESMAGRGSRANAHAHVVSESNASNEKVNELSKPSTSPKLNKTRESQSQDKIISDSKKDPKVQLKIEISGLRVDGVLRGSSKKEQDQTLSLSANPSGHPQAGQLTMREVDKQAKRQPNKEVESNLSVTQQNDLSNQLSRVVSESLLDCRDFGTSPLAEPTPTLAMEPSKYNDYNDGSKESSVVRARIQEFKPIQQINLQLLSQDQLGNTSHSRGGGLHHIDDTLSHMSTKTRNYRNGAGILTTLDSGQLVLQSEPGDHQGLVKRVLGSTLEYKINIHKKSSYKFQRQYQILENIGKHQRVIIKSPNPNDAKQIVMGPSTEIDADTLLNGTIHAHQDRRRQFSPQEQQQLSRIQLFKQTQQCEAGKNFTLSGKHFDANDDHLVASFEQVKSQTKFRRTAEDRFKLQNRAKQIVDLQSRLKALSLEKLQDIYQYLVDNQRKNAKQRGVGEAKSVVQSPKSKAGHRRENQRLPQAQTPTDAQSKLKNFFHFSEGNKMALDEPAPLHDTNLLIIMHEMYNRMPQTQGGTAHPTPTKQASVVQDEMKTSESKYSVDNSFKNVFIGHKYPANQVANGGVSGGSPHTADRSRFNVSKIKQYAPAPPSFKNSSLERQHPSNKNVQPAPQQVRQLRNRTDTLQLYPFSDKRQSALLELDTVQLTELTGDVLKQKNQGQQQTPQVQPTEASNLLPLPLAAELDEQNIVTIQDAIDHVNQRDASNNTYRTASNNRRLGQQLNFPNMVLDDQTDNYTDNQTVYLANLSKKQHINNSINSSGKPATAGSPTTYQGHQVGAGHPPSLNPLLPQKIASHALPENQRGPLGLVKNHHMQIAELEDLNNGVNTLYQSFLIEDTTLAHHLRELGGPTDLPPQQRKKYGSFKVPTTGLGQFKQVGEVSPQFRVRPAPNDRELEDLIADKVLGMATIGESLVDTEVAGYEKQSWVSQNHINLSDQKKESMERDTLRMQQANAINKSNESGVGDSPSRRKISQINVCDLETPAGLNEDLSVYQNYEALHDRNGKAGDPPALRHLQFHSRKRDSFLSRVSGMGKEVVQLSPKIQKRRMVQDHAPGEGESSASPGQQSARKEQQGKYPGSSHLAQDCDHVQLMQTKIQVREKSKVETQRPPQTKLATVQLAQGLARRSNGGTSNSNPGTQRMGKKTLVHSDIGQYQLYMQMKQMQALSEVMNNADTVSTPKASPSALGASSRIDKPKVKSFFQAVADQMHEVFSPPDYGDDHDDAQPGKAMSPKPYQRGSSQVYRTVGATTPKGARAFTLSATHRERGQPGRRPGTSGTINLGLVAGQPRGRCVTRGEPRPSRSLVASYGGPASLVGPWQRQRPRATGTAPLSASGTGTLYQQSFLPAQRMIQHQKYLQQQERGLLRRVELRVSQPQAGRAGAVQPKPRVDDHGMRPVFQMSGAGRAEGDAGSQGNLNPRGVAVVRAELQRAGHSQHGARNVFHEAGPLPQETQLTVKNEPSSLRMAARHAPPGSEQLVFYEAQRLTQLGGPHPEHHPSSPYDLTAPVLHGVTQRSPALHTAASTRH